MHPDDIEELKEELAALQAEYADYKDVTDKSLKLAFEENTRLSIENKMFSQFATRLLNVIEGALDR